MLPLTVVAAEISPACLWWVKTNTSVLESGSAIDFVWVAFGFAHFVGCDIGNGLIDIARHIESVPRSLRNGETEV